MAAEQGDKPKQIPPKYISREKAFVIPPGKNADLKPEDCRHKLPDDIWDAERKWIDKRRENFELDRLPEPDGNGGSDNAGGSGRNGDDGGSGGNGERTVAPIDKSLVGLALSGGGIRSATFSLGVMQALAKHDLMKYVDILSTVSGGGFIGSSLSWLASGRGGNSGFGMNPDDFPYGTDDPNGAPPDPANLSDPQKVLRYLRAHGNYLTPGKGINILSGVAVLLRGTFLNLLVWLPLMAAFMYSSIKAKAFETAGMISLGFLGILLVFSVVYSLGTVTKFSVIFGISKYSWRRIYETIAGFLIVLFLLIGAFALIPEIHDRAGNIEAGLTGLTKLIVELLSLGGPGFLLLGLAAGFVGLQKAKESKLLSKLLLALAVLLVFWGFIVSTYQIADLLITGEPKKLAEKLKPEWLVTPLRALFIEIPIPWVQLNLADDSSSLTDELLVVFGGLLIVSVVTGIFVNVNYISLHRFYRDRLMETFMPDRETIEKNKSGPAKSANAEKLSTFTNDNGPYHILNTNVVLVNSGNNLWKRRSGDNFMLSPIYCGGNATGWIKTKSFMGDRLTMATAVAISGAAANPNGAVGGKGVTVNPLVGFLMALLNIRLGTWVPNPKFWSVVHEYLIPNHFWPGLYELIKLFGGPGYNENRVFLQLSDGGHFENNAFYELFRRRAKLIICCDGGGDPDFTFGDYQIGLDRIKTDFGVTVDITADQLSKIVPKKRKEGFPAKVRFAHKGYATGMINYPPSNGGNREGTTGTLIFLKTTMVEGLSVATLGYRGKHPSFPDETTADQFFSAEQFEAYRELGIRIGKDMIEGTDLEDRIRDLYFPNS